MSTTAIRELQLAFYTPRGVYVYKHKGERGISAVRAPTPPP